MPMVNHVLVGTLSSSRTNSHNTESEEAVVIRTLENV